MQISEQLKDLIEKNAQSYFDRADFRASIRARSERAEIIKSFVDAINEERKDTKFKPITGRAVAMKLSHLKNNFELYSFLSNCKDYKNRGGAFGKCFFGSLKIK